MFDIWLGEIELTRLCLILSLAVILPGQLWLCFRVKRLIWRLLPVIVFAGLTAALLALAAVSAAWESLGYALLGALTGLMLLLSAAGWGLWWLIARKRARRDSAE